MRFGLVFKFISVFPDGTGVQARRGTREGVWHPVVWDGAPAGQVLSERCFFREIRGPTTTQTEKDICAGKFAFSSSVFDQFVNRKAPENAFWGSLF